MRRWRIYLLGEPRSKVLVWLGCFGCTICKARGTRVEKAANVENHFSDDRLVSSRGLRSGRRDLADPQPRRDKQPQC